MDKETTRSSLSQSTLSQEEKMLRGTAWSTMSNIVSRLLGALYIIPWYMWMGEHRAEANGLFNMGYSIYALFLLISTAGIPVAIAKQIAKYNALGKESHNIYLMRHFMRFMLILGIIGASVMYFGAGIFAGMSGSGAELVPVIKSLSLSVLIFPVMSVIRGFFQGYNDLKPFSISQIAEQIIRIIWMLLATFFIMKMGSGDYVAAVIQSTFAAFIGMLASMLVLGYYLWQMGVLGKFFSELDIDEEIDSLQILIETTKEAIPFIVTGAAVSIFSLIDQATFINSMKWFTNFSEKQLVTMYTYFYANPNKIVMILISVASSIGGVGIALITENFVKKDKRAIARMILNNVQMLMIFMIPALTGSVLLAEPLYTVFYGQSETLAIHLFIAVLLQTLVVSFYTMLSPMLLALFERRRAIRYFLIGLAVKVVLQIPLIYLFHSYGPVLSTTIGLLVPVVLMYQRIRQVTHFNPKIMVKNALLIVLMTGIMAVFVILTKFILGFIFVPKGYVQSAIYLVIVGFVGVAVYGYLALLTRSLDKLIGSRARRLRQMLKIESV